MVKYLRGLDNQWRHIRVAHIPVLPMPKDNLLVFRDNMEKSSPTPGQELERSLMFIQILLPLNKFIEMEVVVH